MLSNYRTSYINPANEFDSLLDKLTRRTLKANSAKKSECSFFKSRQAAHHGCSC